MVEKTSYNEVLKALFEELKDYWIKEVPKVVTPTTEESRSELSLPVDAQTSLCFFDITSSVVSFYKSYIFPVLERFGFTPITVRDVISPADNVQAIILSLVARAQMIVIDTPTPNVFYLRQIAEARQKKTIILITEEAEKYDFSFIEKAYFESGLHFYHLARPHNVGSDEIQGFVKDFEILIEGLTPQIIEQLSEEPMRLLSKGEHRAAVISAFVLLESTFREKLSQTLERKDSKLAPYPFGLVMDLAKKFQYISKEEERKVRDWFSIRSKLVHTNMEIEKKTAESIVQDIMKMVMTVRSKPIANSND